MSYILQPFGATNIFFYTHITNSHNFRITRITHLHGTKVPCFVRGKQPFSKDNMVGSCRINNPLNIIISNSSHFCSSIESIKTFSSIIAAVVFFSLSFLSFLPSVCFLFQCQQSFLMWPFFPQ